MFKKDEVLRVIYFEHGASGSGASESDALPIASADLDSLDAGEVVVAADVHVLEAVTGSTQIDVGTSADADGYIAAPALTVGSVAGAGALLKDYNESASQVSLTVAGASSAGKFVVALRGYRV